MGCKRVVVVEGERLKIPVEDMATRLYRSRRDISQGKWIFWVSRLVGLFESTREPCDSSNEFSKSMTPHLVPVMMCQLLHLTSV